LSAVLNEKMRPQELIRDVQKGKILPLYYFYGPEKLLIEEALSKIKEKALDPATRDFNLEVFDAAEHAAETILLSLQALPVRSPLRLVIIRQADPLWSKGPSSYIDYFQNPNPWTCAVFIGQKADHRTKFFQALERKGAAVSFFPPNEKELIHWIRSQAQRLGTTISDRAVFALLERVGPSLQELKLELQKLTLGLFKEGRSIEEEDVLALTGDVRNENLFQLPKAVGDQDLGQTLRLLRKNLQQGDPPILLLSLIVRQLRLIWKARELRAGGCPKKEVETRLRVLPSRAEVFWKQVEWFPLSVLEQAWLQAMEADQELKSSRSDKGLLLEKYIWSLHLLGHHGTQKGRVDSFLP